MMSGRFPGWADDTLAAAHNALENVEDLLVKTLDDVRRSMTAIDKADNVLKRAAKARGEAA